MKFLRRIETHQKNLLKAKKVEVANKGRFFAFCHWVKRLVLSIFVEIDRALIRANVLRPLCQFLGNFKEGKRKKIQMKVYNLMDNNDVLE